MIYFNFITKYREFYYYTFGTVSFCQSVTGKITSIVLTRQYVLIKKNHCVNTCDCVHTITCETGKHFAS